MHVTVFEKCIIFVGDMARNEPVTLMDIVRHTGLSRGTVDRVLHKRGEVSRKSYDKVMQAIEELGYKPNVYASLLASPRRIVIAVILPVQAPDSFWALSDAGIERARESVEGLGGSVVKVEYDQYSLDSFRDACARLLEMEPSGVVIAPMFKHETFLLTEELKKAGIPYVYIDSKPEDDGYTAYFGMPMYQSGYLCADQLTGGQPVGSVLMVRIRRDSLSLSDPTVNRRAGFLDYLAEHNPACSVHSVFINPNEPGRIDSTLDAFFADHPEVRDIAMFNSRIHLIVPWLEAHPRPGRRVVGFDNLAANLAALRRGTVSALIAQHPDEQARMAIESLADLLLLKKEPVRRDNFMHMDILTRYNVEYY